MAGPTADLIVKHGGVPLSAPALREVPLGNSPEVTAFTEKLTAGGIRHRHLRNSRRRSAILPTRSKRDCRVRRGWRRWHERVVARGPKPAVALRELGATSTCTYPRPTPGTRRSHCSIPRDPVHGLRVAVQEFGKPSVELVAGLRQRGAAVTQIPVYRWDLPEDLEPLLRGHCRDCRDGLRRRIHVVQQVEHVLQIAAELGREGDLRAAFATCTVVGLIGPTTSETLRVKGLPVDIEPEHRSLGT